MTFRTCLRSLVAFLFMGGSIWLAIWFFSQDEPVSDPLNDKVFAKGNRMLGIKVNQGAEGDFPKAFQEALGLGNETQVLPQDWRDLETEPGVFNPSPNLFAIANRFYAIYAMPIHLSLRPVHTNQKTVPPDLVNLALDDPETVQRFQGLLRWVADQLPQVHIESLVIGSEVDIFCWGDEQRWQEWTRFYAAVAGYARTLFPKTLITCETTFAAFTGPDLVRVRNMHRHSDAVGVSYYPMKPGLRGVHPPEAVHRDFQTLVEAEPGMPIMVYQIGYPSSTKLGSSPQQQAAFVTEMFRAWDQHQNQITMLNLQWMHETPDFGVDQYADYYQNHDPFFRTFLGSLGLKQWEGEPKDAWRSLARESKVRGFGHAPARDAQEP